MCPPLKAGFQFLNLLLQPANLLVQHLNYLPLNGDGFSLTAEPVTLRVDGVIGTGASLSVFGKQNVGIHASPRQM